VRIQIYQALRSQQIALTWRGGGLYDAIGV
jgi:hypothetical protein